MYKRITILVTILVLVLTAGVRADLEGYWRFDEGSGGTAHDSSGNGKDGTISGAAWYAGGWDGWCLDFDGDNDVVELGAFDVVGPGITLAAWIKPDDFDTYGARIISKGNEQSNNSHWWMLSTIGISGGQSLRFRLKTTDGGGTTMLIPSSGTMVTGEWQHAAAVWDGGVMRIYLDGTEIGTASKGGSAVATNAGVKVAIGSQPSDAYNTDPSNSHRFFDGLIDEVRVYNQGLSASQIQDLVDGAGPGGPPSKDDCDDAKPVGDVTDLAFDTSGATFDGPGLCLTSPNIWYCYTASCTGDVTVSLAGSSFDTMLAVYDGCACYPSASDLIECNDDFGPGYQSAVTFAATAGSQYLIEVGGYGTYSGQGLLTISCEGGGVPPSKDDCDDAKPVGDVTNLAFDTGDATFDGPGLCLTSPNIWYCYTASCTGDVTVSLAGSSFDTMLAVYDGCACYPSASDLIECNDDFGPGYQSAVTFAATAGSQYLIEVGGYGTYSGQGLLTISCEGTVISDKPDLGDAPDSTNHFGNKTMAAYTSPVTVQADFPTVFTRGTGTLPYAAGPAHVNAQVVAYLGKKITRETEADRLADEDGVNNISPQTNTSNSDDGDDGVVVPLSMPQCSWTTFDYTVRVIDPNVDLYVNVWCDWNRDGDWDDTLTCPRGFAPEWAVRNQFLFNLPVGFNQITTRPFLPWHPEVGPEKIWMRITLSEQPWKGGSNPGAQGNAGSGPLTKYVYGETEDYYFTPDITSSICEDYNGDGVIDMDDLVVFTADWLENCQ